MDYSLFSPAGLSYHKRHKERKLTAKGEKQNTHPSLVFYRPDDLFYEIESNMT